MSKRKVGDEERDHHLSGGSKVRRKKVVWRLIRLLGGLVLVSWGAIALYRTGGLVNIQTAPWGGAVLVLVIVGICVLACKDN